MPNVLVIGSANMDVVAPLDKLPKPGETILIGDVSLVPGGKGANAASAAARMGANVKFIGAVGNDPFGQALKTALEKNNIDISNLRLVDTGSGTAIILLDQSSGQNSILVGPGANAHITLPETDDCFTWADAMMLQLETPVEINIQAAQRAYKNNVLTILDPAPAIDTLPASLFEHCHVISPNETELTTLTTMPADSPEEATSAAQKLLDLGAQDVVVKMSSKGALWVNRSQSKFFPAFKIDPIDTTAAGDAFTGAFTAALAETRDYPHAITQGMLAGALACTKHGAQTSIPTKAELDAFTLNNART
ncbi:ribokinase [Poriferisphaera sp. WC338]|uniref:ribokinase n=1 Tax=Poriferisphaera sp. WC338 TaxID=3425129 RepID=UPI003D81554A